MRRIVRLRLLPFRRRRRYTKGMTGNSTRLYLSLPHRRLVVVVSDKYHGGLTSFIEYHRIEKASTLYTYAYVDAYAFTTMLGRNIPCMTSISFLTTYTVDDESYIILKSVLWKSEYLFHLSHNIQNSSNNSNNFYNAID